ncbi:exported hypothetical protein [Syntrophobacter sp. SbD1]|nr:exported hypothetical protein [Syntrophobacter sp. SbD1]
MEISDIKKALAGLCIAGLVSGAGLAFGQSGGPGQRIVISG